MLMKDDYFFLSNFYPCDITLEIDGKLCKFKSAEAAYQAQKNYSVADKWSQIKPLEAKRLGNEIEITTPDWEHYRLYAMAKALHEKFKDKYLYIKLLNVNEEIVEDNYWGDTFWGVYTNKKLRGQGKNMLGKMLTHIKENNNNLELLNNYIKEVLMEDVD